MKNLKTSYFLQEIAFEFTKDELFNNFEGNFIKYFRLFLKNLFLNSNIVIEIITTDDKSYYYSNINSQKYYLYKVIDNKKNSLLYMNNEKLKNDYDINDNNSY